MDIDRIWSLGSFGGSPKSSIRLKVDFQLPVNEGNTDQISKRIVARCEEL